MKTIKYITVIILGLITIFSNAQSNIPYGSNNGKYVSIKNTKLYYEEYGTGTPLVLIHGGLSSIESLAPIIPDLSKHFRVIVADCPGQGRSEQADSLSYALMAQYFSILIDSLKLDSTYVLGYSDGGNIALYLAANRPDKVKKSFAFAAAYNTSGYYPEAIAGLEYLTPETVENTMAWWLQPHLQKTSQKDKWKKFINDFRKMCATPEIVPVATIKKINTPFLIMQGDNDIVQLEHGIALHRMIKGSQLCIAPAASHFILYEKPAFFITTAVEFFTKTPTLFDYTQMGN